MLTGLLLVSLTYLVFEGHRHLGQQRPGRLGVRHHQLRLVDRHRPRRHADLGDPAAAQADVADVDQPLRRGDDAVRRRVRRDLPAVPHRPAVARLLAAAVSEHDGCLAAVPQPARLGRVRGLDLRDGLAAVLVRRADPRPRDAARSVAVASRPRRLRHARDGLARVGAPLAPLRDRLPAARRARDAAGRLGPHRRQLRLRGVDRARLAHDDLSAVLRRRRDLFGLRDGADAGDSDSRRLRARRLHHHAPPAEHGEGDARHRSDRRLRLPDGSVHRAGTAPTSTRASCC